jgi:hypothetical protein
MEYELAKKLKDSGFPQTFTGECGSGCNVSNEENTDFVYCPTLSELIEEVKKHRLKITINGFENHWSAHCSTTESASGSSPEEAVSKLWLALNEK